MEFAFPRGEPLELMTPTNVERQRLEFFYAQLCLDQFGRGDRNRGALLAFRRRSATLRPNISLRHARR